ncbi:MAG: preprotein translocase subunit SecD [Alphaproteobacteria bacterium]|jgi:protein-export membrane protein SecD|nr:preprotein translocase subunit SecD [Alphaproteobacteria bacterium]
MIYIGRWQTITVLSILLFGFLFAFPNFVPDRVRGVMPGWLPKSTINLGLDLQGGSYLLLEVDMPGVVKERMETMRGDIRAALRRARPTINYTGLDAARESVSIHVAEPSQLDAARKILQDIASPPGTFLGLGSAQYDMTDDGQGNFSLRMSPAYQRQMQSQIVSQSIEVVRRRIDALGTREPTIQQQGTDRILVQVPGLKNPEELKRVLSTTAKMTFRLVDANGNVQDALKGRVPPDDELLYETDKAGQQTSPYLVQRRVMVSGDRLEQASSGFDSRGGEPVVNFRFDTRGAREFGDVTKTNVGRPFAIVLDNKVISAPVIREPILGGAGQISGNFTLETANDLSILLNAGALPAALSVIEERTVGAELGADSIQAGKLAAIGGLVAVVTFIILTYGLFGVFATIALAVNMVLLISVLTALQATLTLPGIAGMVLTMGMAVDANVLIYERIREEMHGGKTVIAAIDAGFRRATATITDTNMTHVIAAAILYAVGTGPVRGFAVTLGLGVITSFFTAVMVTRLIVVTWLRRMRPKALTL